MTLRKKNMGKPAEKRPLEETENEPASKKPRAKTAHKIISNKLEPTKTGQRCGNIIIRPITPEPNFVSGDKSVPEGWKIWTHREQDGRAPVMCPQVSYFRENVVTKSLPAQHLTLYPTSTGCRVDPIWRSMIPSIPLSI